MRSAIIRTTTVLVTALLVVGVQLAQAVGDASISGVTLKGGHAKWDAQNDFAYGSGGPCYAGTGYSAVEGGEYRQQSDAFDGGLYIVVAGKTFNDKDGKGVESSGQLTTGPMHMSGLQVTRVDKAFGSSPTLRSLVMFKNPTSSAIRVPVLWDSALGSDDGTGIRATSSGNARYTRADNWFVSSDDPTTPSDPPVTMVTHGPGAVQDPADILNVPGKTSQGPQPDFGNLACATIKFVIKVPARSTRSLLFFTEMNPTNEKAAKSAKKFTSLSASSSLFAGLTTATRATIVNWNL